MAAKMQQLGGGFVRLDVNWNDIEPNCSGWSDPICYNWGSFDAMADQANQAGLQIFATLAYTPAWANGGQGRNIGPNNIQDWNHFVTAVVSRYPSIQYWGMWNEPNDCQFFCSGQTYYWLMASQGSQAVKAANPGAFVVGPDVGQGGCCGSGSWYQQTMSAIGSSFDVASVHWYENTQTLLLFMDDANTYGGGKPVWLTEGGKNACAGDSSQESVQKDYFSNVLGWFQIGGRTWWSKVFPYDLWEGVSCSDAITGPDWSYNKLAFGFYHDFIINHP